MSTSTALMNPTDRFNALVGEHEAKFPESPDRRAKAIAAAAKADPALHAKYVMAANANRPNAQVHAHKPAPVTASPRDPVADFTAAVAAAEAGFGAAPDAKAQAVRKVVREKPELHAAYLSRVNGRPILAAAPSSAVSSTRSAVGAPRPTTPGAAVPIAPDSNPYAVANVEWEQNTAGCRMLFTTRDAYIRHRAAELMGRC